MAGIDYGMGRTNIDTKTGIRYGVISQHSLASWFYDEWEADYGEPHCPKCGDSIGPADAIEYPEAFEQYGQGCADYVCFECEHTLDSSDVYPEEAISHSLNSDGIKAIDCLDSDVMVLESPFYTYAPFCSPCVPGAGNLDAIADTRIDAISGVKTYCLDHTWFEDGTAPYRVFRVSDDTEVLPE